jgi:hypothetical protein
MLKINLKPLYLIGLVNILILNLNMKAIELSYIFQLKKISKDVSQKIADNKPWYKRWLSSKPITTASGIKLVLAFENRDIGEIVPPSATKRYSIPNILESFDQKICMALVKHQPKNDFKILTERDFKELDAIQKKYLDALVIVLQEVYGKTANPYIQAIQQERAALEAKNNGYILGRRS